MSFSLSPLVCWGHRLKLTNILNREMRTETYYILNQNFYVHSVHWVVNLTLNYSYQFTNLLNDLIQQTVLTDTHYSVSNLPFSDHTQPLRHINCMLHPFQLFCKMYKPHSAPFAITATSRSFCLSFSSVNNCAHTVSGRSVVSPDDSSLSKISGLEFRLSL